MGTVTFVIYRGINEAGGDGKCQQERHTEICMLNIAIHTSEDNIKMDLNEYGVKECIGFIWLGVCSIGRTTLLHFIRFFRF
jgi:hypothetical protein